MTVTNPLGGVWAMKSGDFQPTNFASTGAGIQAAIDYCSGGGELYIGPGTFTISTSLTFPSGNIRIRGAGFSSTASSPSPATVLSGAFAGPIISGGSNNHGIVIEGIGFSGSQSLSGSIGITFTDCDSWVIRDCFFDSFADQGILLTAGAGCLIDNCFLQNCVMVRSGRTDYIGAVHVDTGMSDVSMRYVSSTPSITTGGAGSGYICGILIYGSNAFLHDCNGHFGQSGIVLKLGSGHNRLVNCRGEFCQGNGFVVNGSTSEFVSCWAYKNSQAADGASSGFYVTNGQNNFVGCRVDGLSSDTIQQNHGFEDASAVGTGATLTNAYWSCRAIVIRGNQFQFTGSTPAAAAYFTGTTFTMTGPLTSAAAFTASTTAAFIGVATFSDSPVIAYTKALQWKDSGGTPVTVITGNGTVTKIYPLEATEIQFINRADTQTNLRITNAGAVSTHSSGTLTIGNLTSGKYPIISTNGLVIDGPTPLAGTKIYYVSDTSGGAVTRKLTFQDGILTSET